MLLYISKSHLTVLITVIGLFQIIEKTKTTVFNTTLELLLLSCESFHKGFCITENFIAYILVSPLD